MRPISDRSISWKKQDDDIYLFRDNRWYRDDYLEVPASLLRKWLPSNPPAGSGKNKNSLQFVGTTAEQEAAQLNWKAECVSTLTPWHLPIWS